HDHASARDQGADDYPLSHSMLCHRWHAKVSKNQDKNEDVIDAQRIFDEVSSEKIEAGLRSFNVPNEPIKSKRYQDPQYAPLAGRTHAQFPPAALEADEIDRYRDKDADVKGDPKPNAGSHRGQTFTPQAVRQSESAATLTLLNPRGPV